MGGLCYCRALTKGAQNTVHQQPTPCYCRLPTCADLSYQDLA